jgi:hypothetical protein
VELSGQLATFSPADLLARKPLQQWTSFDLEQSVGAWKLLKKWRKEQLAQLFALYERCWGPVDDWTDEQLDWGVEIERCLIESRADDTGERLLEPPEVHLLPCS